MRIFKAYEKQQKYIDRWGDSPKGLLGQAEDSSIFVNNSKTTTASLHPKKAYSQE